MNYIGRPQLSGLEYVAILQLILLALKVAGLIDLHWFYVFWPSIGAGALATWIGGMLVAVFVVSWKARW